jgi:hypothetical protein
MNSRTGLVARADQRAVDHVAERAEALGDRAEDAVAFARISNPKISLTVRCAALAPAEMKKTIAYHAMVFVIAFNTPEQKTPR